MTETNYYQSCYYRLPCGICTRTNSMCPLNPMTAYPHWDVTTTTTGTGTTMTAEEWKKTYGVNNMCEVKP